MPFNGRFFNSSLFRMIYDGDYDGYFGNLVKNKGTVLSPEFQDLFIVLVHPLPEYRATAQQVLQHPWMAGEICTRDEM
jgi:hypothetical protein